MADKATLLATLAHRLRACAASPDGVVLPAAILWTDPERQWLPLADQLSSLMPELLVFGEFDPGRRAGPAIWLRCVVDRTLEAPAIPENQVPILYLPGVGRQHLRAGEDCPPALQPLVELMYRGTLWLQKGGHDWTVSAFLVSPQGLGLDVAKDESTKGALFRALREVAVTPVQQLRGHRLDADDFDRLLSSDVVRDILRWMGDAVGTRSRFDDRGWGAFRSQCRDRLRFDPEVDPDVVAGEQLGVGEGPWAEVWSRFAESPSSFPGVAALVRRSRPAGTLPFNRDRWPDLNEDDEAAVRRAAAAVPALTHVEACDFVEQLEVEHGRRRGWAWARLGLSPMAVVLEPLARLAAGARKAIGGSTLTEIAATYLDRGWQADAASWEAIAASPAGDEELVRGVVRRLLEPWLEDSARVFQRALERSPLPVKGEQLQVSAPEDGCILFADGLRFDLGQRLAEKLEGQGLRVARGYRWAAAPTVTATAKPAVTPVADLVVAEYLGEDFGAFLVSSGKSAHAQGLRDAMTGQGYQVLDASGAEAPASSAARGWLETGEIDTLGHKLSNRLARQIDDELERLAQRIVGLLDAGWQSVRVVTDHGWLLLPGGLPKVDLPKHLTASRWARCAVISGEATPDVPRHPWHWNSSQSFAVAPGIACFNKTEEYAHGGLSVQECLTPDLVIERGGEATVRVSIGSVTWRGLRCFVEATTGGAAVAADLRLGNVAGRSVVAASKPVEGDGSVSLVLAGDDHEAAGLVLVLTDGAGTILAQKPTRVGTDS